MNSEHNKINRLKATPFDKIRANGINQSFLNNPVACYTPPLPVRLQPHMFT